MAENVSNLSYVSLIERVISDYNAIEDKILAKHTDLAAGALKTDQYADKIDRLTYIDWTDRRDLGLNRVTGIYEGTEALSNLATAGLVRDGDTFTLKSNLNASKYGEGFQGLFIRNGVELTTEIGSSYIKDVTLTGKLEDTFKSSSDITLTIDETGAVPVYTLMPNHIVKTINVKKGSVATEEVIPSGEETGIAFNRTLEAAFEVVEGKGKTNVVTSDDETAYQLVIKPNASLKDVNIKGKTKTTVTEGYVEGKTFETEIERDIADVTVNGEEIAIYLPKGGVSISNDPDASGAATATVTAENSIYDNIFTTKDDANSIKLNASVTGELGLIVEYTEGYVEESKGEALDKDNTNVTIKGGEVYIRKGSTRDVEFTPTFNTALVDNSSIIATDDADKNVIGITVKTAVGKYENTAVNVGEGGGYITYADAVSAKLDVKEASKTINIKKAAGILATASVSGYELGGDLSLISTDTSAYKIDVTASATAEMSLDSTVSGARVGYLTGLGEIDTESNPASAHSIYIDRGSVSLNTPTLTGVAVNHDATDGSHVGDALGFAINLLPGEETDAYKAIKGDFIKLTASAALDFTRGFVDSVSGDANRSTEYYIPKATFAWQETDDGEEALHVLTGGYIPSGVITDLTTIGNIDEMASSVSLSLGNLFVTAPTEGTTAKDYEEINVNATINAGYISQNSGSIKTTKFYLKKGKVDATAGLSFDGAVNNTITGNVNRSKTDGSYSIDVKATATANYGADHSTGYISEFTTGTNATKKDTLKITLPTAIFDESTHTTDLSIVNSTGLAVDTSKTSSYYVEPKIDSCSVAFTVAQAGYISGDDIDVLKFETGENGNITHTGERNKLYIKAADTSKVAIASTNSSKITTAGLEDGKLTSLSGTVYTVTLGGKLTGNITGLDSGYYGSTELANVNDVAKDINIPENTFFNIDKGNVTVAVNNASSALTSTGLTLYTEGKDEKDANATFAKIDATASIGTTTTITEGYVTTTDKTEGTKTVTGATYVKLFETKNNSYSNSTKYGFTVGNNDADASIETLAANETVNVTEIATAGKYMSKNTVVEINDHAMGASVLDKLIELQNRLNGVRPGNV